MPEDRVRLEGRFWQALTIVAISLSGLAPAYVTLHSALQPPLAARPPQKKLVASNTTPSDLLGQLNGLGNDLHVSMSVSNQAVTNIYLLTESIQNTGDFPISTRDYQGNLSFNIAKPWKIVAFSPVGDTALRPNWNKLSDQNYETPPLLFNPGDKLALNLYVTDVDSSTPTVLDVLNIQFRWNAHIEGVQGIAPVEPIPSNPMQAVPLGLLMVTFDGVGLIIFPLMSAAFIASYLYLLDGIGIQIGSKRLRYVGLVVGAALLSISAAEAVTTLLWTSSVYGPSANLLELNLPPILINICLLAVLLYSVRTRPQGYGFELVAPREHASIKVPLTLKGTLALLPPATWGLWVFTTDAISSVHWPQAKARFTQREWDIEFENKTALREKQVWLQFYVVGPVGQAFLVEYRSVGSNTGQWPPCPLPEDCIAISTPLHYLNGSV